MFLLKFTISVQKC